MLNAGIATSTETNSHNIIQWNCQGMRAKKEELIYLIDSYKPSAFALQETMLGNIAFSLSGYTVYNRSGHYNRKSHGGVAICIHNSIPHTQFILQHTETQIIAVKVTLDKPILICSIYISRSHRVNIPELTSLMTQLTTQNLPILLLGDFNAYHTAWGSDRSDQRGVTIFDFINKHNLNLLNTGEPTHTSNMSKTAIDLSISSLELNHSVTWSVMESCYGSDHYPIRIDVASTTQICPDSIQYNYKQANWHSFTNHHIWNQLEEIQDPQTYIDTFYDTIYKALDDSVPRYRKGKYYPKPWWSQQLQDIFNKREEAFKRFKQRQTVSNLITWKRYKALFQYHRRKQRKENWQNLCNGLNPNTPLPVIYSTIRRIKGQSPYTVSPITVNNKTFSTLPEITNQIAIALCKTTSSKSCSTTFLKYKQQSEAKKINFHSNSKEEYNQPFTLSELKYAIAGARNTAPGPDNITNETLRHLPHSAMNHLLKIFNLIYTSSYFPTQWCHSYIIPIAKQGKDATIPTNYRPIALTSVICKTMERMINRRLTDYFDMNKSLTNIQCGGRSKRSTIDHLVRLEHSIRESFAHGEHTVSIFFDIEKAYDLTWREGVLIDLYNMGLRGYLPKFVQGFLHHRTFQVRVKNHLSPIYTQEMGIPQGAILSVTLFAVKINSLANVIPKDLRYTSSLYVDDFQLSYRHTDLNIIRHELQSTLDKIQLWSHRNGFKFSFEKTKAIHFTLRNGIYISPNLKIYNKNIEYKDKHKFLGLIWDRKLNWQPHIEKLINNCLPATNLLKSLTSYQWGAHQDTLLHLYRLLVRSRLDYGSIVYNSAAPHILKRIDTLVQDNLRIISGCFRSTPVQSLYVLLDELPLTERRNLMSLKYYSKTRSYLSNPAHSCLTSHSHRNLYQQKNLQPPFSIRIKTIMNHYNIEQLRILNDFSYRLLQINNSTLYLTPTNVDLRLTLINKYEVVPNEMNYIFNNHIKKHYCNHKIFYTDGSKRDIGVGAAVVCPSSLLTASLPKESSILTAEIQAINMAIQYIEQKTTRTTNYLICSDSLSALTMFTNQPSTHPLIRRLQHRINKLSIKNSTTLMWIPSHCGITGNERADKAAQSACNKAPTYIPIIYSDYFSTFKSCIEQKWNDNWKMSNNKMVEICNEIKILPIPNLQRKLQVIFNRLRAGHTNATHKYLMDRDLPPFPPLCSFCTTELLTVKHIMSECTAIQDQRDTYFGDQSWTKLLFKGDRCILQFLESISMFNDI